jgi:hypothetical protein
MSPSRNTLITSETSMIASAPDALAGVATAPVSVAAPGVPGILTSVPRLTSI